MLGSVLTGKDCSDCKLCCRFDEYEVWELPIFNELEMEKIKEISDAEFFKWGNIYRFKITPLNHGELLNCPALTEKGCSLGENKPFECAVWPFRVMEVGEERFICVSTLCEPIIGKPLNVLTELLLDGLAAKIFNFSEIYPDIIKPFNDYYVPLISENNPKIKSQPL
jgi:Fe-S-cluster containining protein